MPDLDHLHHIDALERDNARLQRLLDGQEAATDLRDEIRDALSNLREIVRHAAETSGSVEECAAYIQGWVDNALRIESGGAGVRPEDAGGDFEAVG